MPPVAEALRAVLAFLAAQHVDYMVMGGLAVRVLALPRTTLDVDVMVAIDETDVGHLAEEAAKSGFLVDEAFQRGFVDRLAGLGKFHFQVVLGTRSVRVDVFVLGSDYQRIAFGRRRLHTTDLGPLVVMSAEDLLLHKLLANRPRDRSDVADLLLVGGAIDMEYVRTWAERLGVTARLAEALREAGREA